MAMDRLSESGSEQVLQMLGSVPDVIRRTLIATVNDSAKVTRKQAVDEITAQVNLSRPYVNQRLTVRKRAKGDDVDAVIGARSRGTGLRRFDAIAHTKPGKTKPQVPGGVSVKVKPNGTRKLLPNGFFINLNSGLHKGGNAHLAYRPYDAMGNPVKGRDNFKIAYGPSVSQVWNSVRHEVGESPAELLDRFYRQLEKIANG